ncbi:helix-turn-helix domain-containing protein [Carnobacterium gallinarum]|uniref:helix-turn-helix domain-containing protein n=1 Tax=Carnobacterium gallinarum TaxID=2749 RepID=UPI00054E6A11|nr:helix-turn-helix domain-containing protein [Carnobacterium gallinarum]
MEFLLEKADQRKLELFSFLELNQAHSVSLYEIKDALDLSEFLAAKTVSELIADIEIYDLEEYYSIVQQDKMITLTKIGKDSINRLIWHYLKDSRRFKLLDYVFKTNYFSLQTFYEKLYMSKTKAFTLKTKISDYLQKHEISLSADYHLIGNEKHIRLFLFQLYFTGFKNYEFPFDSDITKLVEIFEHELTNILIKRPSESQRLKLSYFLAIIFQRLDLGHVIEPVELNYKLVIKNEIHLIENQLNLLANEFTSLPATNIHNEITFIIDFLISEDYISSTYLDKKKAPQTSFLTAQFISQIESYFNLKLDPQLTLLLINELDKIHYRIFYYKQLINVWHSFINQEFLKENYIDFYNFCQIFIHQIDIAEESVNIESFENVLLYDYIFVLLKYFPTDKILDPIYVTIDFSYGENYNHFIQLTLKNLPFLYIKIENSLSSHTDIYLSDILPSKVDCDYLIWNSPPTASDWEAFGNLIIKIRQSAKKRSLV